MLTQTKPDTDIKLRRGGWRSFAEGRCKSFVFAWNGVRVFFKTEANAQVHLFFTVVAVMLSFSLPLSKSEILFIVFSVAFVWMAEVINTVIEKLVDFISVESDPRIKIIKDMAAGAVLIASAAALLAGLIIFLPKLLTL
jgi:diacylglycerol kinase (ATP)